MSNYQNPVSRLVSQYGWPTELNKFFERALHDADGDQSNVVTSQWAPRVDIKEEDTRFVIFADIPGVDPAEIEIQMDKGILTIKGERMASSSEENAAFSRVERSHGVFYRRFSLPDSADADGVSASGRHGVLEISIPKKPETTPRRIQVQ